MPNSGIKVVFFGNERLVSGLPHTDAPILNALIADGYDIVCIVSSFTKSTSRRTRELEVAEIAARNDIPLLLPKRVGDIADELRTYDADVAVLVAFGQIIPQFVIDIFPYGIINVHPSLLPRYRGPTPIEAAVTNGDSQTGVSIMQLSAKMDAGPVFAQETVAISPDDTKFNLYNKIAHLSAPLLIRTLPGILSGEKTAQPQSEDIATYSRLLTKDDGRLNPGVQTAAQADRLVRAHLNYPKSKIAIGGRDVIVTRAHIGDSASLFVTFKDGVRLAIDELIAPSGKKMSGEAFLRGYGPLKD